MSGCVAEWNGKDVRLARSVPCHTRESRREQIRASEGIDLQRLKRLLLASKARNYSDGLIRIVNR